MRRLILRETRLKAELLQKIDYCQHKMRRVRGRAENLFLTLRFRRSMMGKGCNLGAGDKSVSIYAVRNPRIRPVLTVCERYGYRADGYVVEASAGGTRVYFVYPKAASLAWLVNRLRRYRSMTLRLAGVIVLDEILFTPISRQFPLIF